MTKKRMQVTDVGGQRSEDRGQRKPHLSSLISHLYCGLLLLTSCVSFLFGEIKIAPYYNFQLTEGVSLPSKGRWSFDLNLSNDLGLIAKLNPQHSLVCFYQLKYVGPGIKRQEGEQFTDRNMDHLIALRHHWSTPWNIKLKSQIDYWKQFRRSGTNELWGTGLYDMDRFGGLIGVQKDLGAFKISSNFQYHSMIFPNYTDLISELRVSTGGVVESSVGKQDHALTQIGAGIDWRGLKINFDLTLQNYFKQKVIVENVQPDGSFYSSTLQQENITTFKIERGFKLGVLSFGPAFRYSIRGSNQNYHHFENIMSTSSSGFYKNYYSYNQMNIILPVNIAISKKWDLMMGFEQEQKNYADRPARTEKGEFSSEKQQNILQFLTLAFNYKPNPVTTTTLYYVNHTSSSNMKFEKYFPYNYTVASYGVTFSYQY